MNKDSCNTKRADIDRACAKGFFGGRSTSETCKKLYDEYAEGECFTSDKSGPL
jgi:hypothetical protein